MFSNIIIPNIIINIKSFGIILDYLMYCKNKVFLENKDPFDSIIQSIQVCKHVFSLLGTEFKIEEDQQPKQKEEEQSKQNEKEEEKKKKQEAIEGEEQRIEKEETEEEWLKREPEENRLKEEQPKQKEEEQPKQKEKEEEKKERQEPKEEEEKKFYEYVMKLHQFSTDKRIFKN